MRDRRKILVLGSGGLMGRYLVKEGRRLGESVTGLLHRELDITDALAARKVLEEERPDWVVNAAACSRMEECAAESGRTRRLNSEAPALWAELCHAAGVRFCHVSSDYVFDGKKTTPYVEEDRPAPLSEYARQKTAGDAAVAEYAEHLNIRVAWLFGMGGATFMSKMPALLQERKVLQVAEGRTGSCLYAGMGAAWLYRLIQSDAAGLFNLVHPGAVTWEIFLHFLWDEMGRRGLPVACEKIEVLPMEKMAGLQEPRPAFSVLNVEKLERHLGGRLEGWQEGAGEYLTEWAGKTRA